MQKEDVRISCVRKFKSIHPFEEREISEFSILIGKNGAGKSQLLDGLSTDCIKISYRAIGEENRRHAARFVKLSFSDDNIQHISTSNPSYLMPHQQRAAGARFEETHLKVVNEFESLRSGYLRQYSERLKEILNIDDDDAIATAWRIGPHEAALKFEKLESLESIKEIFEQANNSLAKAPYERVFPEHNYFLSSIRRLSRIKNVPLAQIDRELFKSLEPWGSYDFFLPDIGKIFARYRDAQIENRIDKATDQEEGTATALSDAQFHDRYGEKPWETFTNLLQKFGMHYELAPPPAKPLEAYQIMLINTRNGERVRLEDLSSGEKFLVRFVSSLFQYDETKVQISLPEVLLLDEVDNVLHPSALRNFLETLKRVVADELGIVCILATHSPTAVALGEEGGIYRVSEEYRYPTRVSKQEAVNELTEGVPTLSLSWEGRRQVFVESETDAVIYDALFIALRSNLGSERSLNFLSTGVSRKGVEAGTGRDAVTRVVATLREYGNTSIFGLIDWDCGNEPSERILVMGYRKFRTLENIVLNPLAVYAFLVRQDPDAFEGIAYLDFLDVDNDMVSKAFEICGVEQVKKEDDGVHFNCFGGFRYSIPARIAEIDGHAWEAHLAARFPELKRWTGKGRGQLSLAVAQQVYRDFPSLIPETIADTFASLLAD